MGYGTGGAWVGGAEGKPVSTSDSFPSSLLPYHVENSSIARSWGSSRGVGYIKRGLGKLLPAGSAGLLLMLLLWFVGLVFFFLSLNRIQMFWPRGKIEVFLFSSSPSGLQFLVLLIFKPLPLNYYGQKYVGNRSG